MAHLNDLSAETKDNAHLIAGAPELLAACKLGYDAIQLSIEAGEVQTSEAQAGILSTIHAAIAKAKEQ